MKDVANWSDSFIVIWWYPEYASRKQRVSQPEAVLTIWSMHGKENGSFAQALLRPV